ncbi:hypothetical protein L6452_04500 [Arctium lappa]|uniref:Uncharacterized protein n=1 Tax=Arctium lappa TaxID=4217 RepID=A0ACB9ED74_ARCLA|nr:hypothetical protein L6452_04500 [Arctium lappa]
MVFCCLYTCYWNWNWNWAYNLNVIPFVGKVSCVCFSILVLTCICSSLPFFARSYSRMISMASKKIQFAFADGKTLKLETKSCSNAFLVNLSVKYHFK